VKTLKYYIVPALILLALFLTDRCSAAETCTPAQLQHVDINDDHGVMCLDLSRTLTPLVQLTQPCDAVVGIIADPRTRRYFVTCRVLYAAREWFPNYASINGAPFQPRP
jgi:hypothetical protein